MKKNDHGPYLRAMLAGFGAISLSVAFFFVVFRINTLVSALNQVAVILRPIIIGGALAYLLRPLANRLEAFLRDRLKWRKTANALSVTICTLLTILLLYLLVILIVPQLYTSINSLRRTLPGQLESLVDQIETQFANDSQILSAVEMAKNTIMTYTDDWVQQILLPNMDLLMNGVTTGVVMVKDLLIGLIAMVYLLAVRHTLCRQAKMILRAVFRPKWNRRIMEEITFADKRFGGFISGKAIDSLIIGVLCYIFSLILGFPSALLISVIVGVTNIVPFFGPFIGAIPSILLILIQEPIQALWFALFILVLQQLDGNIIGPKILGSSTGLSSFWVLFSILLFGGIFGFVGMIIAVPSFAVIYDIVKKLVYAGIARNEGMPAPPRAEEAPAHDPQPVPEPTVKEEKQP